jgi:serine protease Do
MRSAAYLSGQIILCVLIPLGVVFGAMGPTPPAKAELYRYKKDGVWHFTDTPSPDMPADRQAMVESGRAAPAPPTPEGTPLLNNYPARNAIEEAVKATVAVKSPWGYGSGFFISPQGYIITNRHVVRSQEQQNRKAESSFEAAEGRISDLDRQFADEHDRLQAFKDRLAQLKNDAEAASLPPERRRAYRDDYEANRQRYDQWRADYERRLNAYQKAKQTFRENRQNYDYSRSVADLAQSFTIILADNTELYARLVHISTDHDLALLKLDGYRTPALIPGQTDRLAQSDPVYAIGNPIKLHNSVASGVFSGFQQGFLQTNAQIYPGNSGGPLVSKHGRVLGINTFKMLTRKFEGLGFAIPIETAMSEFSAYLNK